MLILLPLPLQLQPEIKSWLHSPQETLCFASQASSFPVHKPQPLPLPLPLPARQKECLIPPAYSSHGQEQGLSDPSLGRGHVALGYRRRGKVLLPGMFQGAEEVTGTSQELYRSSRNWDSKAMWNRWTRMREAEAIQDAVLVVETEDRQYENARNSEDQGSLRTRIIAGL